MLFSFFRKYSSGIDVEEGKVRFVKLYKNKKGIFLSDYGEENISDEIIFSNKIISKEKLDKVLLTIKKQNRLKNIFVSLSPEGEAKSIATSIIKDGDGKTYLITNFEKNKMEIFVYSNGEIIFSNFVDIKNINIENVVEQIERRLIFWHKGKDINGNFYPRIERVLICGDNPDLRKISNYLSTRLKVRVEIANVWVNIFDTRYNIPILEAEKSAAYAGAIGLALRALK